GSQQYKPSWQYFESLSKETKLRILENRRQKTTDEDVSFFDSLLPHIRTFSPQRKLLLRMKIQQVVYNFAYGSQERTQEIIPPQPYQLHVNPQNGLQLIRVADY
ncbi:hypothetical protein ILUMI_18213, partial [Ignelater luminosus]